jgi:hypothetical protein
VEASSTTEREARIGDVVRSITVQSARAVARLGSWARFDKEIANDLVGGGFAYSGVMFEIAARTASRNPIGLEAGPIARLFRCFEAFEGSARESLRVSADRLNQALCRPNVIDKAIDLGIALEVLLLHSIGPKELGELKYRFSIRGAMFLGGSEVDRLNTFKLLKDAYDLRSKAVHAGALTAKKNASPPTEILDNAANICARIARNVIERGSFPDWEAEYVIGDR